ncbi:response regulator [Paracnuella aquatica]|uniref:response regulator n=1 Tax=Paracnuella aquatica TaxID=2268757 RepID=UPI000DEF529D|nr:response regulator [Paracnuella aquatica]RPD49088.1 response regulator [Paracnuella aquatica]
MKNQMLEKHTILWADDDMDDLEMFREIMELEAPDHELIEFRDGQQLLTFLKSIDREKYPCLIVLDMNMPVLSGKETLTRIKSEPDLKNIPVVIFTTSINPADKRVCDQSATEMIIKPPSFDQLRNAVKRLLLLCSD